MSFPSFSTFSTVSDSDTSKETHFDATSNNLGLDRLSNLTSDNDIKAPQKVCVVGGGSFGTAIATVAARNGHQVQMYIRDITVVDSINTHHRNHKYLSDHKLPTNIRASLNLSEALQGCDVVFLALPTQTIPEWIEEHRHHIQPHMILCNTAKGMYAKHNTVLSQAIFNALQRVQPYVVISGPSFAVEMIQNIPTAVVVGSPYLYHAVSIQRLLTSSTFKCVPSQDMIGVELCGALKNTIAIGAGLLDGLNLGINTKSAYISLASAEMQLLVSAPTSIIAQCSLMGGQKDTILGLAGIGDLMLTAFGQLSRNRSMGCRLAQGESAHDITSQMTVEGVHTAHVVLQYGKACGLELPIFRTIADILTGSLHVQDAGKHLLGLCTLDNFSDNSLDKFVPSSVLHKRKFDSMINLRNNCTTSSTTTTIIHPIHTIVSDDDSMLDTTTTTTEEVMIV